MSWAERIEAAARAGRFTETDIVEAWSSQRGPAGELGLAGDESAFVRWLCEEIGWAVLGNQFARARQRLEEMRFLAEHRRKAA